jgi:SAM-dependent methyltransferase
VHHWANLTNPVRGYVDGLLERVPAGCRRALDVGCGAGELSRRLAAKSEEVLGIDRAEHMVEAARHLSSDVPNVSFELGDFLAASLPDDGFDFVLSVASIHHMDFDGALARMATVTRPGGVVAVLGLANEAGLRDFAASAVGALQLHTIARRSRGGPNVHNMPILDATMTYGQVANRARRALPGVIYRRHPVFRYSLVWRRPA